MAAPGLALDSRPCGKKAEVTLRPSEKTIVFVSLAVGLADIRARTP